MKLDNDKHKYYDFCEQHAEVLPIFYQPWWLDIVCGGSNNWNASVAEKKDVVLGVLPYFVTHNFLGKRITLPPLSQILGPFLSYPNAQKYATKLSFEKKVLTALLGAIETTPNIRMHLPYNMTNVLPFHWAGYQNTIRCTYRIDTTQDPTTIWSEFRENIRREIRKSEKTLTVITTNDPDVLYELNTATFSRQNMRVPFSKKLLSELLSAVTEKNQGTVYLAVDSEKNIHAGICVIHDQTSAYYLLGGASNAHKNSGAMSLLLWHALQETHAKHIPTFNFEGSMIEGIERFFRGFGARQQPYISVSKNTMTKMTKKSIALYRKIRYRK